MHISKIFIKSIVRVLFYATIYILGILFLIIPKVEHTVETLAEQNGREVLHKIVTIVKNAHKDLESFKRASLQAHKDELKHLTDTVVSIVKARYEQSKDEASKKEVLDLVRMLRYNDNNYFFIIDYNNIVISHPFIQGKDMSDIRDKKGNLIVPPMVKIARENGEGYYSYWWKKNRQDDNATYEKLSYVTDFPQWKMVIGTGVYLDDIQKEVARKKQELLRQLREIVKTTKIGKTGYVYIFSRKYRMLIHPNSNIDGKDMSNFKTPGRNTYILSDLINASKTKDKALYYKWDKPDDPGNYIYDKVSWVEYVPEFDWYIASSVYLSEFKDYADNLRYSILYLSLVILTIILSLVFFFLKRLLRPVEDISRIALNVSEGNYSIRSKYKSNDEIGTLSNAFNKMVDTIEDNIKNLELKVKLRTKELSELNEKMRDSIEYASIIQKTLLPRLEDIIKCFDDVFVYWMPKDIVGGDIYLFERLEGKDEFLLMVIDCTGHGVSGAFVTMLVKAIEREIVTQINNGELQPSPAAIMACFNKTIKKLLHQEKIDSVSNAGFDGGIIYIDKVNRIVKYCGAQTSLFVVADDKLREIKGDRYSVGYKKSDAHYKFTEHTITIGKETRFYILTDGYFDQTGGEKGFPFGKKRLKRLIEKNYKYDFDVQKEIFIKEFMKYKGGNEQKDDITFIGFKL